MTRLSLLLAAASAIALSACQTAEAPDTALDAETNAGEAIESVEDTIQAEVDEAVEDGLAEMEDMVEEAVEMDSTAKLAAILAAQPEDVQARYDQRHPADTLAFFGIEPGMTVVEGLPGGGWYTKILLPYVGPEGKVIGAHYPDEIWAKFRPDDTEWQASRAEATANWPTMAGEWEIENPAAIGSYTMTSASDDMAGTADAVLFIRALHNLHRFNSDTGWFEETIAETYDMVKPGGVVGVVQHRAPEANSDASADGNNGYLKQSRVVEAFEAAGFILEASSELNANAMDVPGEEDIVWRLRPSLATTEEGTPEREAIAAIGETDRMTLRFRKPA